MARYRGPIAKKSRRLGIALSDKAARIMEKVTSTDVEVTYEYTALSESGRRFLEHFSEDHYKEFINGWKTHLLHYFQSK